MLTPGTSWYQSAKLAASVIIGAPAYAGSNTGVLSGPSVGSTRPVDATSPA